MARDFKAKTKDKRAAGYGSWMSFVTGLLIGLTVAVVVYFTRVCAPTAPDAPLVSAPTPPPVVAPAPEPEVVLQPDHSALAPTTSGAPPDFEFYKILPGVEVKVPESELAAPAPAAPAPPPAADAVPDAAPPAAVAPVAPAAYVLQVGSFQNFSDADQAKAQLALQGITSSIQRVVVDGNNVWFRVQVGPYTALADVQSMRTRLIQAGASVVVLKIGGGQP